MKQQGAGCTCRPAYNCGILQLLSFTGHRELRRTFPRQPTAGTLLKLVKDVQPVLSHRRVLHVAAGDRSDDASNPKQLCRTL